MALRPANGTFAAAEWEWIQESSRRNADICKGIIRLGKSIGIYV